MSLNFYMGELLWRRYHQLGGHWVALEKDIEALDEHGTKIERRKLARLAAGNENEPLTIAQLRCLQNYVVATGLAKFGENPFFRPPGSLLDMLRGEQNLTVFYPSRYLLHFQTEGGSRWDLKAMQAINEAPEVKNLHSSFQDVFHRGSRYENAETLRNAQSREAWHKALDEESALISIGAPYACYATEEILARMFDVTPYEPVGLDNNRLPFYLYWPECTSESAFSVTAEELRRHFPEQFEQMGENTRAVIIGNELHPAPKVGESMNLVVAQYWGGHTVMVLLGIYAPSTLAIAEMVANRQITESLGPYQYTRATPDRPGEAQPILINKIRTTITVTGEDGEHKGRDTRRPAGAEAVGWERWQRTGEEFELQASGRFAPVSLPVTDAA